MSSTMYSPGDILWVKCGQLHWPAQVLDEKDMDDELKADVEELNKKPLAVVKFFNEESYEFIKDWKNVFPYNCDKKEDFIKKGIVKSRSKSKEGVKDGWFSKFPKDIVLCEELTKGDPDILQKEPFVEKNEKVNYKEIFGSPNENEKKQKKQNAGRKRKSPADGKKEPPNKRPIVHPRFMGKASDHTVKILPQPSAPYHLDLVKSQETNIESSPTNSTGAKNGSPSTPGTAGGKYSCHICGFSASRLNVIILHSKTHSEPTTPNPTRKTSAKSPGSSRASKRSQTNVKNASSSVKGSSQTPSAAHSKRDKRTSAPRRSSAAKPTHPVQKENNAIKESNETNVKKVASPAKSPSKKPRLSKKEKETLEEKKEEQRKKILGDWSEEEEEEKQEKMKLRDVLEEPLVVSSDEEENEAWMMEDNIQGNVYEGDEDDDIVVGNKKHSKDETIQEQPSKETNRKEVSNGKEVAEAGGSNKKDNDLKNKSETPNSEDIDINKVLEETEVPELPRMDSTKEKSSQKSKKKSVSFDLPKEVPQKCISLVQAESNLDAPPVVDDEFDEFLNDYPVPTAPPKMYPVRRNQTPHNQAKPNSVSKASDSHDSPMVTDSSSSEERRKQIDLPDEESPEKKKKSIDVKKKLSFADDWEDEEEEETPLLPASTSSSSSLSSSKTSSETSTTEKGSSNVPVGIVKSSGTESAESSPTKTLETTIIIQDPSVEPVSEGSSAADDQQQNTYLPNQGSNPNSTQVSFAVRGPVVSAVPQVAPGTNLPEPPRVEPESTHQQILVTDSNAAAVADVSAVSKVLVSAGATLTTVAAGNDGDTYLILVDDGSGTVDSLNSQTLYIDPSQLTNGELSNMVLMTNDGVAVSAQPLVASQSIVSQGSQEAAAAVVVASDSGTNGIQVATSEVLIPQGQVIVTQTERGQVVETPVLTSSMAPQADSRVVMEVQQEGMTTGSNIHQQVILEPRVQQSRDPENQQEQETIAVQDNHPQKEIVVGSAEPFVKHQEETSSMQGSESQAH